jgi:DNA-binding LacI/PurR family transcriptional regulator
MVGIRDIAAHLNVSVASVSRALNNQPYVNEELRQRVVECAKLLGYQPKQSGRSLRQGMSKTIGFMIETHPTLTSNIDLFLMSIFDGVQIVMRRHALNLVVLPCSADEDPVEYLRSVVERRFVDALILSATRPNDKRVALLAKEGIPFITLGRTGSRDKQPWIDLDFESFAEQSVDRLYRTGNRRIAIMVPAGPLNFGQITLAGYKRALAKREIGFDPALVAHVRLDEASAASACGTLLTNTDPPTGIILINEALASGVYTCLRQANLVPGRDVEIVSLEDGRLRSLPSPLTRFRFATHDIGIALGESLLSLMPAFAEHYAGTEFQRLWQFDIVEPVDLSDQD